MKRTNFFSKISNFATKQCSQTTIPQPNYMNKVSVSMFSGVRNSKKAAKILMDIGVNKLCFIFVRH